MSERPHILVLYSHNPSRLAHLRKIASLRDCFEFTLLMDEQQAVGWQAGFVDRVVQLPLTDTASNSAAILRRVGDLRKPAGILHLSEPCLPLQVLLCEHYGLRGPSRRAAEVGRNKHEMRKFAHSLGIPIPRFTRVTGATLERARELHFPVVAKPIIGGGSTLVQRFDDYEGLAREFGALQRAAAAQYGHDSQTGETLADRAEGYPFVVEELVGGTTLFPTSLPAAVGEISVESVAFDGEVHVLAIHDKPLPSNGPHFEELVISTPTRIPPSHVEMARDFVGRIHGALGPGSYVLHTEFRTLPEGLVLLEFGIRIGGGPVYRSVLLSTGNDFIEILIDLGLGRRPVIRSDRALPTITPLLFAPSAGRIRAFKGESKLMTSPVYVEHQLYDDIGHVVARAPLSSRCNAHVTFQSSRGFEHLERGLADALSGFEICVE